MTRRGFGLTVGVLSLVVGAALALFALVLVDAQRSSREDVEARLRDRAAAGATLIGSVFEASATSGRARLIERYGGEVSEEVVARQARESRNVFLAVAEADGTVLATSPGAPAGLEASLRAQPRWFRAALRGVPLGSSNVRDSVSPDALSFAQAIPATDGTTRVLVSGSSPRLIAAFFAGSLERLPTVRGGRTFLLDADGAVLASAGGRARAALGERVREEGLERAIGGSDHGDLPDGRFFASSAVRGTPWQVVVTVPAAELFATTRGVTMWGPWALFVGFALAAMTAIALVARVSADSRRMRRVNAQLGDSNVALEERTALLTDANSQLEQANTELGRSNAELERFASIASHDLREPLRKVQMFSERIIHHESEHLSDRGKDYLARMDAAAARMQSLIDGLLAYARVTTRPEPLEEVDLGRIAREVADDLDVVRRDVGGRIELGTLPAVAAEPLRMRQLLQNLMSNALRFHRDGVPPVVRVTGEVQGDDVVLEVADNGIGFEERHAERIFGLFERLHPRDAYAGTGMGLALCRRIVERHRGTITARSVSGQGSTFTIRLPRTPRPDDAPPGGTTTDPEDTRLVAS